MVEVDYSQQKGVSDEKNFDVIVERFGGERIDALIERKGVKQADYLFREQKVVAEHKFLETEFGHTPEAEVKVDAIFSRYLPDDEGEYPPELFTELRGVLRAPIQRIIKKANTQIRDTKQELGLVGFEGVLLLVNDNFRSPPPALVMALTSDILSQGFYKSIRAVIYITNHFVELPDHPDALLLWAPMYSPVASDSLVSFINEFGRLHGDYTEEVLGKFTSRDEHEFLDLRPALTVTGIKRNYRYIDPKTSEEEI
ncbi:hypothetical protein DXM26_22835 [Agrobacterium tumefaciens]|uniref:hypothetical protein n=1 Tax=Agrobacterium tumefaciens TaxID=358 RepID=UPI00122FE8D8|nr:hypothetical protein DXM26_22835 [Agrobacterium tumefaciens]